MLELQVLQYSTYPLRQRRRTLDPTGTTGLCTPVQQSQPGTVPPTACHAPQLEPTGCIGTGAGRT